MRTTAVSHPADPAPEPPQARALLAACGDVSDERVLIVGPDSLDAMCALIREGARQVTALRHADRPEAASADLVVAPYIVSADEAEGLLAYTRRALAPFGRVVLMLPTKTADQLARRIVRMLPGYALSLVRVRPVGAWTVIAAERPFAVQAGHADAFGAGELRFSRWSVDGGLAGSTQPGHADRATVTDSARGRSEAGRTRGGCHATRVAGARQAARALCGAGAAASPPRARAVASRAGRR